MTEHPALRIRSHSLSETTSVAAIEPLLSPDEVAVILGIPVKTLYQWRYKGVGPRGLRIGRHVRYRSADVEAWLREVEEKDQRGNVA